MKKLVVLQQADPNLKIVPNMAHTAKRFIRWKNKYEQQMDESYDLALLLTRYCTTLLCVIQYIVILFLISRVDLKFGSNDHTGKILLYVCACVCVSELCI